MRGVLAAALLAAMAAPAAGQPVADPRLVEAIGWYTGTRGLVDDAKARLLIETDGVRRQRAGPHVAGADVLARADGLSARRGQGQGDRRATDRRGAAAGGGRHGRGGVPDGHAPTTRASAWPRTRRWPSPGSARPRRPATRWPSTTSATPTPLGAGVAADPVQAVEWWLKAAAKGDAVPQLRLGEAYEAGRGVAKNLDEARRWYAEAATARQRRRRRRRQAPRRRRLTRRRRTGELLAR